MSEEDEEKERPTKKHFSFAQVSAAAEAAVPDTAQQKGRKRRRTLDGGDKEEGDKERPSKVRVTTAHSSSKRQRTAYKKERASRRLSGQLLEFCGTTSTG